MVSTLESGNRGCLLVYLMVVLTFVGWLGAPKSSSLIKQVDAILVPVSS